VPSQIVIAGGATSASFTIGIHDNTVADGAHPVTITATRPGAVAGSATLSILDDDGAATLAGAPATDAAPHSKIVLSSLVAPAATDTIQLRFSGALDGALDGEVACDTAKYFVSVNGQRIEVEAIAYPAATHSVVLSLPESTLKRGDEIEVRWNQLSDTRGALLSGSERVVAR